LLDHSGFPNRIAESVGVGREEAVNHMMIKAFIAFTPTKLPLLFVSRGKISKKSMIHNDAMADIEVNAETHEVRADGEFLPARRRQRCRWRSDILCFSTHRSSPRRRDRAFFVSSG
jgi:hypothetical protein